MLAVQSLPKIDNRFKAVPKAPKSLILTVIELQSRRPNFEDSMELGQIIHDFKTVRILSREPLPMQAVTNVLKRNEGFKLYDLKATDYSNGIQEF